MTPDDRDSRHLEFSYTTTGEEREATKGSPIIVNID
jgi:hypothetical protein